MPCNCNGCGNYENWKEEAKKKLEENKKKFQQWLKVHRDIDDEPVAQPFISVADWMRLRKLATRPDVVEEKKIMRGEKINA